MNFSNKISHFLAKEDMTSGFFDNVNFGSETALLIFRIILAIAGGCIIAAIVSVYDKRYLGSFVRKLIQEKCHSPEKAKTLYDLGFDDKLGVRWAIKRGNVYGRFLVCVEEQEFAEEELTRKKMFRTEHINDKKPPKYKETTFKADIDTARYYIPEEKIDSASRKFSAKGSNWLGIFIVLVILAILLGLCIIFLPKILELAGLLLVKK